MRKVTRDGVTWEVDEPTLDGAYCFWDEWEAGWEQDTLDVLERFLPPTGLFLDVGAWVGAVSLWAVHLGAHVIAVEPDPGAVPVLTGNLYANTPSTAFEVFAGALALDDGWTQIRSHAHGWGSSMTHLSGLGAEPLFGDSPHEHRVAATTLQTLLAGRLPSLVKVDVEGGECFLAEHLGPFCAEHEVPLLMSMHEYAWTRPLRREWFAGFSETRGDLAGLGSTLFIP